MFNKRKIELYLLPLFLLIFLVTYYLYRFYESDFKKMASFVNLSFKRNGYEDIMKQHPYYALYSLSKTVKNPEKNVLYVRTKVDRQNKQYLRELTIMVDYYFYPHKITAISAEEFKLIPLTNNYVIISDYPLAPNLYSPEVLRPFIYTKSTYFRVNRKKEDDVFIFTVNQ
jgi:hypothetical protein